MVRGATGGQRNNLHLEVERLIELPLGERILAMDPSSEYWQRCAEALLRDEVQTLIAEREWIVERLEEIQRELRDSL